MEELPTQITDKEIPLRPLRLPTFIFLMGGSPEDQEAISSFICQNTLSTLPDSMLTPVRSACAELYYNNPADGFGILIAVIEEGFEEAANTLAKLLCREYGEDLLGKLAVASVDSDLAENFIFSDTGFYNDIQPFIDRFGAKSILVIKKGGSPLAHLETLIWGKLEDVYATLHTSPTNPLAHSEGSAA